MKIKIEKDWKEFWVDEMGLIVALSGQERFDKLIAFKKKLETLPEEIKKELINTITNRFTPSSSLDGCKEAINSINYII